MEISIDSKSAVSIELLKQVMLDSTNSLKAIEVRIQQIDTERQSLVQEILRRDGEIRVLDKILKSAGV
jgi:hypothetical protein